MDDDLYLETNQGKMLSRLSAAEIRKRFGNRDDPAFQVSHPAALLSFKGGVSTSLS